MTKVTRIAVAKKETVKKREKKLTHDQGVESILPLATTSTANDITAPVQLASSGTNENIHEESIVKEKSKREKNSMPKKPAKKEQEVMVTATSEGKVEEKIHATSPSVPAPSLVENKNEKQNIATETVPTGGPLAHSHGSHPESKEPAVTTHHSSDASGTKPKFYPHQQQQYNNNKKFNNKKPQHKNAHPQSSHYAQQGQQGGGHQQNYGDRYDNRSHDGYHKPKDEGSSKQPFTREQLEELSLQDLYIHAKRHGVVGAVLMSHKTLVEKILEMQQDPDREIVVEGVLEKLPDGFGFLRSARFDYVSSPDDIYVSPAQIRKMGLRTGDTICGTIRRPKENEKYFALARIDKVNFSDPAKLHERPHFDRLSPMHPNKKFTLEYLPHYVSTRIMDIFTPIGKGQRGLIVAPPKAGKTVLSKEIAQSLIANHPEIFLIMLLIDERPEEVADMKRFVKGAHAEVISSTFDEPAERHVQVAEIVLEKAKRLVEVGKDVVIFLDSVTRLARAYNTVAPASGKILTGGVDANSLQRPKRFFGAARCLEEGGSLTILGSALIETGSRMDEVIYEEFKGTGNMEIHMSRKLSNRRIYPAFDLLVSGTRRDELLQSEEELNRSWVLQKFLANMNTAEAMEFLLDKMKKFKTNEEFFESMNPKKAATNGNGTNGNHPK